MRLCLLLMLEGCFCLLGLLLLLRMIMNDGSLLVVRSVEVSWDRAMVLGVKPTSHKPGTPIFGHGEQEIVLMLIVKSRIVVKR